jgi:hypothetical protein
MGLFGSSRADALEQQLYREQEERLLLINYVSNLERLCSRELAHAVEELQAAHQAAREDAYRDFNEQVNFSRRPNFTRYALAMQRRNFEVTITDPSMRTP